MTSTFIFFQSLLKKMSRLNDGSGWFPWKSFSLLLVLGIVYLLQQDVAKHGSYKGNESPKVSRVYFTGKALTVKQLKKEGVGASDISNESL